MRKIAIKWLKQAEADLKSSQSNYLNSLYDLAVSKLEFRKAAGLGLLN